MLVDPPLQLSREVFVVMTGLFDLPLQIWRFEMRGRIFGRRGGCDWLAGGVRVRRMGEGVGWERI